MFSELFDRSQLRLKPLSQREHDLDLSAILEVNPVAEVHEIFVQIGKKIRAARGDKAPVILIMGAHVLRSGVQGYLIDLLQKQFITALVMNGACVIHDFELALIGATTESVARYIQEGQFGLWKETGKINEIINQAAQKGLGVGQAMGQYILAYDLPHKEISLLAQAAKLQIPATVHITLGADIVHEHPNCNGAAWGQCSYQDFLTLARIIQGLEGGVVLCFGSAVTGPEVFLKALAMARNVAKQKKQEIKHFTTLVCDLLDIPTGKVDSCPEKSDHRYYFRPWKTLLVRTIADGGQAFYYQGWHQQTIPQLWSAIVQPV